MYLHMLAFLLVVVGGEFCVWDTLLKCVGGGMVRCSHMADSVY